ncbi:caspase family protein [Stieleria sp. TO1_6]|uniref:caspase family protein n=1 Tax=Stieleria tagensis TaxID=2956795 RepID=UPI00209B0EDE|nr:caspase family protein [Stieleria tagensis]MCO8123345.1 caspase family protein [Stieleria tagensis]
MRKKNPTAIWVSFLLLLASGSNAWSDDSGTETLPLTSSEKFAILIGVNYTQREAELAPSGLKPLSNAANDAVELSKVLTEYYGYQKENTIVLTDGDVADDGDPNESEINEHIKKLRLRVDHDDSILVFFAGHALKRERAPVGEQVALLPLDIEFDKDRNPVGSVGLPDQLFKEVDEFNCQHTLIVLDCCYSGEIFNSRGKFAFQPASKDDRSDTSLQLEPSFQAMASCRDNQVSGDAPDRGGSNSKFTTVFLDGLKYLPIRNGRSPDGRVWANRLLTYVKDGLSADESQRPDCRHLGNHSGEFCFTPTLEGLNKLNAAAEISLSNGGHLQLKAMVASCQGNWWFDEMPWFVPGIRTYLMQQHSARTPQKRSSAEFAQLVDIDELRETAEELFRDRPSGDDLLSRRYRHAELLFDITSAKKLKLALETIRDELTSQKSELKEEDLHLLAVVLHKLGREHEAKSEYKNAISAYEKRILNSELEHLPFIAALCRADYGEFLTSVTQHKAAAEEFATAAEMVQKVSANRGYSEFFRIYAIGRQADAKAGMREWKAARELFDTSERLSEEVLPGHMLHAHVLNRRAWLHMKRWELADAQSDFAESNEILTKHFTREDGTENHVARITALHNQHGIAMLTRFRGETSKACEAYLQLDANVHRHYHAFLSSDDHDPAIQMSYIERLINTRERLGDCNLFGDPARIDPLEAFDDYRRAISLVHLSSPPIDLSEDEATASKNDNRQKTRAILTYKQALTLCLDSSIQDLDMAYRMAQRADQVYEEEGGSKATSGSWQALGELTTLVVKSVKERIEVSRYDPDSPSNADQLRDALLRYRDIIGSAPHRDQLEICLFASKMLLDSSTEDRYQSELDGELLHSLCRLALSDSAANGELTHAGASENKACEYCSELREYLRPYYDAIIRVRLNPKTAIRVKDLIELQSEATNGRPYSKPLSPVPVLAVYELDDEFFLFTDIPHGISRCDQITEMHDIESIRHAIAGFEKPFPLPRQIRIAVADWIKRNSKSLDAVVFRSDSYAFNEFSSKNTYSVMKPPLPDPEATNDSLSDEHSDNVFFPLTLDRKPNDRKPVLEK